MITCWSLMKRPPPHARALHHATGLGISTIRRPRSKLSAMGSAPIYRDVTECDARQPYLRARSQMIQDPAARRSCPARSSRLADLRLC